MRRNIRIWFFAIKEPPYKTSTVVKGFMQKPEYADFVTGTG